MSSYTSYGTSLNNNEITITQGPGLILLQKEKYGAHLFTKNEEGNYICFFKDCGKHLSTNFSRHISKHESEGTPLDPIVLQSNNSLLQSPDINTNTTTTTTTTNYNNTIDNNIIMGTPQPTYNQYPFGFPMHHPMVQPPGTPSGIYQINPMIDMMATPQHQIQPIIQQTPPPPIVNTPTTRSSVKNNPNNPVNAAAAQLDTTMTDKKGVPYQVCQHPLHMKWWGTSSVLPSTEFYTRASKCKKCYIKQQQDSKKLRSATGINIGSVAQSVIPDMDPSIPTTPTPKVPMTRNGTLMINPPGAMMNVPPSGMIPPGGMGNTPMKIPPYYATPQKSMMPPQQMIIQPPQQPIFKAPAYPVHHQASISRIVDNVVLGYPLFNPFPKPGMMPEEIVFRAKVNLSPDEVNRNMLQRVRAILASIIKDSRSKYFREPVDPIKLGIPNYLDIIKEPMDLGTIDKRLNAHSPSETFPAYTSFLQFDSAMRLVFKNAMLFNEKDTDVYELAEELEKEYIEAFDKALNEVESTASLNAELFKGVCSKCKKEPYFQPKTEDSSNPNSANELPKQIPLLICEGTCMRAFHHQCLFLPLDTQPPYICKDCKVGRNILHYDNQRNEYFYYYYDGVQCYDQDDSSASAALTSDGENETMDSTEDDGYLSPNRSTNGPGPIVSEIGCLAQSEKIKLREEEEKHLARDMYYDPVWCIWRVKSKVVLKEREERQKQILEANTKKPGVPRSTKKKKAPKKRYG